MQKIKDLVLTANPELDVRIDQCEIVRISRGEIFAGIEKDGSEFIATISIFHEPGVFGKTTVERMTAASEIEIVKAVLIKFDQRDTE